MHRSLKLTLVRRIFAGQSDGSRTIARAYSWGTCLDRCMIQSDQTIVQRRSCYGAVKSAVLLVYQLKETTCTLRANSHLSKWILKLLHALRGSVGWRLCSVGWSLGSLTVLVSRKKLPMHVCDFEPVVKTIPVLMILSHALRSRTGTMKNVSILCRTKTGVCHDSTIFTKFVSPFCSEQPRRPSIHHQGIVPMSCLIPASRKGAHRCTVSFLHLYKIL